MNCNCKTKTNVATKASYGASEWLRRYLEQTLATQNERNNNMLTDLARYHLRQSDEDGVEITKEPVVNGMRLCWGNCMSFLYGVSERTLRTFKRKVEKGEKVWVHEGRGQGRKANPKELGIIVWIQDLKDNFAEADPTDDKKFELPPGTTCGYWSDYAVDMLTQGRMHAQYDWFRKVWIDHFPELKIPESPRWVGLFRDT